MISDRIYDDIPPQMKILNTVIPSVVPMIDYNQKSFIYLQPIIDLLVFWESIIIGKILQEKNFIFIEH